jgi:drug/metabolite transporter superfamily protein YnfA
MLDELFYYFVRLYLTAIIFGIAGGFLILSYMKLRKKTYLIMGVGFLYLALGTVILYFIQEFVYYEYAITYSFLGLESLAFMDGGVFFTLSYLWCQHCLFCWE